MDTPHDATLELGPVWVSAYGARVGLNCLEGLSAAVEMSTLKYKIFVLGLELFMIHVLILRNKHVSDKRYAGIIALTC